MGDGAHTTVETHFQPVPCNVLRDVEKGNPARIRSLTSKLRILEFKGTRVFICLKKQVRRAHMSCSKPQGFPLRD